MCFVGSDVVPVELAATWVLRDYVGQASRRYRRLPPGSRGEERTQRCQALPRHGNHQSAKTNLVAASLHCYLLFKVSFFPSVQIA
jgi:hypothetical protein